MAMKPTSSSSWRSTRKAMSQPPPASLQEDNLQAEALSLALNSTSLDDNVPITQAHFAPMDLVPWELLVLILETVLASVSDDQLRETRDILGLVCQLWRTLVFETPSCWSFITSEWPAKLVQQALLNSKLHPIHIFSATGAGAAFIDAIRPHAHRLASADVIGEPPFESALFTLDAAPRLNRVCWRSLLHPIAPSTTTTTTTRQKAGAAEEEHFRSFEFKNMVVFWQTPKVLVGLHALVLNMVYGMRMAELLIALAESPQLRFLELESVIITGNITISTPMVLADLTTLRIRAVAPPYTISNILVSTDMPNLKRVEWGMEAEEESPGQMASALTHLIPFLGRLEGTEEGLWISPLAASVTIGSSYTFAGGDFLFTFAGPACGQVLSVFIHMIQTRLPTKSVGLFREDSHPYLSNFAAYYNITSIAMATTGVKQSATFKTLIGLLRQPLPIGFTSEDARMGWTFPSLQILTFVDLSSSDLDLILTMVRGRYGSEHKATTTHLIPLPPMSLSMSLCNAPSDHDKAVIDNIRTAIGMVYSAALASLSAISRNLHRRAGELVDASSSIVECFWFRKSTYSFHRLV